MKAHLNFVNYSYEVNNPNIVVYQKNHSPEADGLAVAWRVIKNCGFQCHHPFSFSGQAGVVIKDAHGNCTPEMPADPGSLFRVFRERSGRIRIRKGKASDFAAIQIRNEMAVGAIGCEIVRDAGLLAARSPVAPGQTVDFSFGSSIFVGAGSRVEEGQVLGFLDIRGFNQMIDLLGITSADLLMTGGGPGSESTALAFHLQNVKYWPV